MNRISMKNKFIAIVLSLSMLISLVPSFSLTFTAETDGETSPETTLCTCGTESETHAAECDLYVAPASTVCPTCQQDTCVCCDVCGEFNGHKADCTTLNAVPVAEKCEHCGVELTEGAVHSETCLTYCTCTPVDGAHLEGCKFFVEPTPEKCEYCGVELIEGAVHSETCLTYCTCEPVDGAHLEGCKFFVVPTPEKCEHCDVELTEGFVHLENCLTYCTCTPIDGVHLEGCKFYVVPAPVGCAECFQTEGHSEICSQYVPVVDVLTEPTTPQVGDVIWIKKGSNVYKTQAFEHGYTLKVNHKVEVVALIQDEFGSTIGYEFKFTSWDFTQILIHDYKFVHIDNISVNEPTDDETENLVPECSCEYPPESGNLADHANSCERQKYVISLFNGKTAEEIYAEWSNYDDALRVDLLNMLQRWDNAKYEELLNYIGNGSDDKDEPQCICGIEFGTHQKGCPLYSAPIAPLPSFPACDCSGGIYAGHDEECSYAEYMIDYYFATTTTRDIYNHWESLDETAKNGIWAMLEAMDPHSLQELQAMLNGEANEVATIVNGMSVVAVGAIPDGVSMAVTSIDAFSLGFESSVFAYDISFSNENGTEWQPTNGTVKVTIDAGMLGIENGTYVKVYHIDDNNIQTENGRYMVSGGKMTIEADSFSGYVGVSDGVAVTSIGTTDAPIIINLFDYGSLVTEETTRSELALGMGGGGSTVFDYELGNDAPVTAVDFSTSYEGLNGKRLGMYPVLQNGYPARAKNGGETISLNYLFDKSLQPATSMPYDDKNLIEINGAKYSYYDVLRYPVNSGNLFSETSNGYFEFDSRNNHAWYSLDNGVGTLNVESYAVNPSYTGDRRYTGIGHFLPFNGPITQYDFTDNTGDAYVMKKDGTWKSDDYKSKSRADQNYKVDESNFVNTQANTLYAIKKGASIIPQNRTNMWIGMSVEFDFNQPQNGKKDGKDMIFEFSGDDLMWVYIDDVMVLDISMSGTHDRNLGGSKKATINFSTGEVIAYKVDSSLIDIQQLDTNENGFFDESECTDTFDYHVAYHTTLKTLFEAAKNGGYISTIPEFKGETFADFETLSFKMFYMDTGHGTSNCSLKFNMDPLPSGQLSVKKVETNLNDEIYSEKEYEFELWKKGSEETEFHQVTDATFTISGEGANANNDISADGVMYTIGEDGRFSLKDGQTATFITGITVKDTLEIREVPSENYTTTHTVDGGNPIIDSTANVSVDSPDVKYDVVFTNQWNSADLTIAKKVVDEHGGIKDSSLYAYGFTVYLYEPSSQNPILTKTFPLQEGYQYKIDNIPVNFTYEITETLPKAPNGFEFEEPLYSINGVDNDSDSCSGIIAADTTVTVTNTLIALFADLKITKSGFDSRDENQTFLFKVTGTPENKSLTFDDMIVAINGNNDGTGSTVIKELPVGTYYVEELTDWSWRYIIDDTAISGNQKIQEQTITNPNGNYEVTFVNKRNQPFWLSGDSYIENWWGNLFSGNNE